MPTRPFRICLALLAALSLAAAGCGGEKKKAPGPGGPEIKALRFAGVDLVYALERIATEAGLAIALDEIMPKDQSPDLSVVRVDLDLPAGPLDNAMRILREKVGGFDYQILPDVLYVRSNLLIDQKTSLDLPLLDGGDFEGDLAGLVRMIMMKHPSSYISVDVVQGEPVGAVAKIRIPEKSSVKDALIQYAGASKVGWRMKRAGFLARDPQGNPAIFGTAITATGPRTGTSQLPVVYNRQSAAAALADTSKRLDVPLVVYDRTAIQDRRGFLNLVLEIDPKLPQLDATLNNLGQSGWGPTMWNYQWKEVDGVPVLMTRHFLHFLRGRDLLGRKLLPGEFEGSLPELARWINTHAVDANGEVLMGGEIADGQPRGKVVAGPDTTVAQAIEQFARTSRTSPYVVVFDPQNPLTGQFLDQKRAWRGAYLQDLAEWRSQPGDELSDGVVRRPEAK